MGGAGGQGDAHQAAADDVAHEEPGGSSGHGLQVVPKRGDAAASVVEAGAPTRQAAIGRRADRSYGADPDADVALLLEAAPLPLRVLGMPTGEMQQAHDEYDEPAEQSAFERQLRSQLDGLLVGGSEMQISEWDANVPPDGQELRVRRERVRQQAIEDERRIAAATTVQTRVRSHLAQNKYAELRPRREYRFCKTYSRVVGVGSRAEDGGGGGSGVPGGGSSAPSGPSAVYYVQSHERLELVSAHGVGRLMLTAADPNGNVVVTGSCVFDSSLHALVSLAQAQEGGLLCAAPGEHLYTFTVQPQPGATYARLRLRFRLESLFAEGELLSSPPPRSSTLYEDRVRAKQERRDRAARCAHEANALGAPPMPPTGPPTGPAGGARSARERRRDELAGGATAASLEAARVDPAADYNAYVRSHARASEVEWLQQQQEEARGQAHLAALQLRSHQQLEAAGVPPQPPPTPQPSPLAHERAPPPPQRPPHGQQPSQPVPQPQQWGNYYPNYYAAWYQQPDGWVGGDGGAAYAQYAQYLQAAAGYASKGSLQPQPQRSSAAVPPSVSPRRWPARAGPRTRMPGR